MNLHEINAAIKDHLTKQKSRAVDEDICLYRAPEGQMCAVGCLIDDGHYSGNFEEKSIADSEDIIKAVCDSVGYVPESGDDIIVLGDMLSRWQDYHDTERQYQAWCDGDIGSISPEDEYLYIEKHIIGNPCAVDQIFPPRTFGDLCEAYGIKDERVEV